MYDQWGSSFFWFTLSSCSCSCLRSSRDCCASCTCLHQLLPKYLLHPSATRSSPLLSSRQPVAAFYALSWAGLSVPLSSFLLSHHPLQFRKALVKMRKVRRRGRKGSTHHKLQAVAHASPQNCLFWGLVLEPHFAQSCGPLRATLLPSWLADFAATPQGCCACVGQVVVCRASSLHLQCLSEKWKMPIEDKHFLLAPNSTVLLGFCSRLHGSVGMASLLCRWQTASHKVGTLSTLSPLQTGFQQVYRLRLTPARLRS